MCATGTALLYEKRYDVVVFRLFVSVAFSPFVLRSLYRELLPCHRRTEAVQRVTA